MTVPRRSSRSVEELAAELKLPDVIASGVARQLKQMTPALIREIVAGGEAMLADARAAFLAGDAEALLCQFSNEYGLEIVSRNATALLARGIYESTLIIAWSSTRTNWADWSLARLERLFGKADRERLRAAGDPLPAGDSFTLYRGVAGVDPRRKEAGYSWTRDRERAEWFAKRFAKHFRDPAVLVTQTRASDVLAYVDANVGRNEDDFILRAKSWERVTCA